MTRILKDPVLWSLLLIALVLRLYLASTTTYIWDEDREFLPTVASISLQSGAVNLPLRTAHHGALPAYFIAAGAQIVGNNPLGFRIVNLLMGVFTVLVFALTAYEWKGRAAALWCAALLAFNEYHIFISSMAWQKPSALFFSALATYTFILALERGNIRWTYLTGIFAGLGFLCYESVILLVPVFCLTVIFSRYRSWFLRIDLYVAASLCLALVLPDLYAGIVNTSPDGAPYEQHLSRLGHLGFTRHYFLFFFRDAIAFAYRLSGRYLFDPANEFAAMNSLFGFTLFGSVAAASILVTRRDEARSDQSLKCLLLLFWGVLGFFVLQDPVRRNDAPPGLDPMGWYWLDLLLIPGALVAAFLFTLIHAKWRYVVYIPVCAAMLYSSCGTLAWRLSLPSYAVGFEPESLWPPDGNVVEVRARFIECFLCDPDPEVELLDIAVRTEDGTSTSVVETEAVEHARVGTDDVAFRLRAVRDDADGREHRRYIITYRLTDDSGHARVVSGFVRVPVASADIYKARFWTKT